eukprot:TRINITY_DN8888_c0_g1_i2.p1 TRINITY_DN8888_c0_g1~~TRINITY_DN8888_c0_g1_i2.p1  ORF type:complete len:214 (+),score=48.38 TRINITY_DN8888_c0_g1_i2:386-1027(+)
MMITTANNDNNLKIVTSGATLWLCAASEQEKASWIQDLNAEITILKKKNEFYDEQHTKIASQRAAAAKALIAEQYAGYRVYGSGHRNSSMMRGTGQSPPIDASSGHSSSGGSSLTGGGGNSGGLNGSGGGNGGGGGDLLNRLEMQKKAEESLSAILREEEERLYSALKTADEFKANIANRHSPSCESPDVRRHSRTYLLIGIIKKNTLMIKGK